MRINFIKLEELSPRGRRRLYRRSRVDFEDLIKQIAPILDQVRDTGDQAVIEYTRKFDGADFGASSFRVSEAEISEAVNNLSPSLREAIEVSIANIRKFHVLQKEPERVETEISPGIIAGEKTIPLDSVGIYVPRGKGSFPSMMMMAAVPAVVAGVRRIVAVSPPDQDGKADSATIAAAGLTGVSEIYAIGGPQAIAALAFGTQSVAKVDKIVGPGSGYVLAAKKALSTEIDTGPEAGPSEAIVYADDSVSPFLAVTDLLIEAEHGPDSSAYLITTIPSMAQDCLRIAHELVSNLPPVRREYCQTVLAESGGIVLAKNHEDAVDFINGFAPEHLQLLVRDPEITLDEIRTAGEVLIGPWTPGTLANYSIGPNAILPTSGFAKTSSALSVRDFTRKMSYSIVSESGFRSLAPITLRLAEYEGFFAHARALSARLQAMEDGSKDDHGDKK
jgi:histidinol dehydrogenase